MRNPTKYQIRWVSQILGFQPFFFFFFFLFFLSYIMYSQRFLCESFFLIFDGQI